MKTYWEKTVTEKTDEELVSIYFKSDDYQPDFYELVEIEILRREIPAKALMHLKQRRAEIENEHLKIGIQGNVFMLTISSIGNILLSIPLFIRGLVSLSDHYETKTLDLEGERVFVYNTATRKLGRIMIKIGLFVYAIVFTQIFISFMFIIF